MGLIFRPTTVVRDTYKNIKETGVFTINSIHESIIEDAHHTAAKYDAEISEFDKTCLKPLYKSDFYAPFVEYAPLQMAMQFVEEHTIQANQTILVVAEIKELYLQDNLLQEDGFINLSEAKVATINSLDGYAVPQLKTRLDYQRPK